MPLFDKVKAQATQLAQKAQEAGKAGQTKLEDAQARRRADAMLRELGAAIYVERSGRGSDDTATEITRLVAELSDFEAEHGPLGVPGGGDAQGFVEPHSAEPKGPDPEPLPKGGFTLDA